jgi:hypothetical protein
VTVGGRSGASAVLLAALGLFAVIGAGAEARIAFYGSTGLSLDGLVGYLGEQDRQDRIVVETDEAPVHLLFFWDSPDLDPRVTVTNAAGKTMGAYSLARSNRITLSSPGRYVLMLSSASGTGHWFCVLLGSREWDMGR